MVKFMLVYLLGLLFILLLAPAFSVCFGVPFIPTHRRQARLMIDWAEIKPGMKVVDLGSGAGRLLFLAAEKGASAVGYELNPSLVLWTRLMVLIKGMSGKIEVRWQSLYEADLRAADVVLTFLMPGFMKRLSPKLHQELKSGAKLATYAFSLPGKEPILHKEAIYIYQF